MYSLIIAEDELAARRGLVDLIKWNELGFQVDGEFSDGQQVLAYLESNMPDIILTDIKMSRVSGLEIAKLVMEKHLPVQVVLLSGHREFSYAQSAVEYRVLHYLLKPVSVPKLREVFTAIREKLDMQEQLQNTMLSRRDHYEMLIDHQRQSFVVDALSGTLSNSAVLEERLQLLAVPQDGIERLLLVRLIVQNTAQGVGFFADYGLVELQEEMTSILRHLDPRLEYYPVKWEEKQKGRLVMSVGVFWEKADSDRNAPLAIWKLQEKLESEVRQLSGIEATLQFIKGVNHPGELATEGPVEMDAPVPEAARMSASIEQVMSYISLHYCEDITLNDVASAVYLNPIYISRLIKERTGKGFSEWLMEMRIKKAVSQLRHTDLYVYQIAEEAGYRNLKYFYKIFKKVTGKSPNDYRTRKDGKGL